MAKPNGGAKGSSNGGSSGGGSTTYEDFLRKVMLHPYWANLALLVVTAVALAAMIPPLIMMFRIRDNIDSKMLRIAFPSIAAYVSSRITRYIIKH